MKYIKTLDATKAVGAIYQLSDVKQDGEYRYLAVIIDKTNASISTVHRYGNTHRDAVAICEDAIRGNHKD